MSERVITTTIQITKVYRDLPECFDLDKKAHTDNYKQIVEDAFKDENVDSVVVTNVHEVQLQGLRDQMDDEFIDKYVDVEAEKIIEKMKKDDRLINKSDVMVAIQKVLISLGYEPLGEEVNQAFEAIESIGVYTE